MTKGKKIALSILAVLALLIVAGYEYVDRQAGKLITERINHIFDGNDSLSLHVGEVDVNLLTRTVKVDDLTFTLGHSDQPEMQTRLYVERIKAGRLDMRRLFREKAITIDSLEIKDVSIELADPSNHLHVKADGVHLTAYNIGYSLEDTMVVYNDSCYHLSVSCVRVLTPDSLTAIEAHDIRTANRGPLHIGKTRIRNTVGRWELGPILGTGPHNWIDLSLDGVRTSPLDIHALAMHYEDGIRLDSLFATIADMQVFTDLRSPSEVPLPMPQEAIMKLSAPIFIAHTQAVIKNLDCEVALTDNNSGTLHLKRLNAIISNITPNKGATLFANITGKLGQGDVHAIAKLTNNDNCNWSLDMEAIEANLDCMNDFLHPMVAIEVGGQVHSIKTAYKGDRVHASGKFCMLYSGLTARVDEEADPAFQIIHNMGPLINSMVKTVVPHSNPRTEGKAPNEFAVSWTHDIYRPAALFMIGPTLDGIIKTMLPGLFLRSKMKDGEEARSDKSVVDTFAGIKARKDARAARREARAERREERRAERHNRHTHNTTDTLDTQK